MCHHEPCGARVESSKSNGNLATAVATTILLDVGAGLEPVSGLDLAFDIFLFLLSARVPSDGALFNVKKFHKKSPP